MNHLRITGGQWRSRRIAVTEAISLRPTPDRVRETLFNWLKQDLSGWHCLDLFAGSGILGLECASRGAATVVFVEAAARVTAQLKQNLAPFGTPDRLRLVRADALEFTLAAAQQAGEERRFDLLLLDPPYRQGWLDRLAPHFPALARPGMRIYAEAEYRIESLEGWHTVKRGQAGQVFYHLLEQA